MALIAAIGHVSQNEITGFALGRIGLGLRLVTGERLVGYGSYVPWGLWVAICFHAVGIAGGAFVVGDIG